MQTDVAIQRVANATLPISRLLIPEIFSGIIHLALDDDPPLFIDEEVFESGDSGAISYWRRERHLGVAVVASHVCFTWRVLCIGTPSLWARQIGRIPNAVSDFLERSGHALLDIEDYQNSRFWLSSPRIDPARVRSLDIIWSDEPENAAHALLDVLTGNLLNARRLDIYISCEGYRRSLQHMKALSETPNLAELSFSGVYANFSAPRLTSLQLNNSSIGLSQLLGALRTTPMLRSIELDAFIVTVDCDVDLESLFPSKKDPVRLPQLWKLHMTDYREENVEDGFHGLLYRLWIEPASLIVISAWGCPFPLLVMGLRTAFQRRSLPSLRLSTLR